ncbi:hypothetical protein OTU49_009754 [Cherax quadricarinatus]|uniref:CBF1-interacting co-repressor CIR N-terminal domain-containing protein n=1 Tax=Cherax quadricarinatus TaxID=27406 RepID=A0AAW0WIT1_CHEQU
MGGGDLNLKKSWHPHTMKNQERVWKAEQQKAEEDRKMAELQRELKEEREREMLRKTAEESGAVKKKTDDKLDWMYKGPGGHVSREEYLLGRKIDKAFEMLDKSESAANSAEGEQPPPQHNKAVYTIEHEINPESVIHREASNVQVDMRRKLMEDPLLVIRQREEETKRQITSNPVKMKQLQQLQQSELRRRKRKDPVAAAVPVLLQIPLMTALTLSQRMIRKCLRRKRKRRRRKGKSTGKALHPAVTPQIATSVPVLRKIRRGRENVKPKKKRRQRKVKNKMAKKRTKLNQRRKRKRVIVIMKKS